MSAAAAYYKAVRENEVYPRSLNGKEIFPTTPITYGHLDEQISKHADNKASEARTGNMSECRRSQTTAREHFRV